MVLYAASSPVGGAYKMVAHGVGLREVLERYLSAPAVHLTFFACAVACVGLIARRTWAANLVRISAVWNLGLQLPHIPLVAHNILPVFFSVLPDDYTEGVTAGLILVMTAHAALFVALIISASRVVRRQDVTGVEPGNRVAGAWPRYGQYLIITGIAGIALGLIVSGAGGELIGWRALPLGRAVFVGSAVVSMAGQCCLRSSFSTTSALTLSAILLPLDPLGSTAVRTIEIWLVPLIMGFAGHSCAHTPKWMRVAGICLPILLLAIELTMPWVTPPNLAGVSVATAGP